MQLICKFFFKLQQISKKFSSVFIERTAYICGATQFKPVRFKGQLYIVPWAP